MSEQLIFNFPFLIAAIQSLIVCLISFLLALIFEEFSLKNIQLEIGEILYAGILSSGFAFLLQIYGQRFISPAPVAIIFSLEGVFGAIAAWFILDQILNSAREVLSRTGTVTNDDVVTNTLTARIDKRTVYVTVKEVEPLVTEVTVQVRTSRGTGDLTVASEIDKQIALGLVLPQN